MTTSIAEALHRSLLGQELSGLSWGPWRVFIRTVSADVVLAECREPV